MSQIDLEILSHDEFVQQQKLTGYIDDVEYLGEQIDTDQVDASSAVHGISVRKGEVDRANHIVLSGQLHQTLHVDAGSSGESVPNEKVRCSKRQSHASKNDRQPWIDHEGMLSRRRRAVQRGEVLRDVIVRMTEPADVIGEDDVRTREIRRRPANDTRTDDVLLRRDQCDERGQHRNGVDTMETIDTGVVSIVEVFIDQRYALRHPFHRFLLLALAASNARSTVKEIGCSLRFFPSISMYHV